MTLDNKQHVKAGCEIIQSTYTVWRCLYIYEVKTVFCYVNGPHWTIMFCYLELELWPVICMNSCLLRVNPIINSSRMNLIVFMKYKDVYNKLITQNIARVDSDHAANLQTQALFGIDSKQSQCNKPFQIPQIDIRSHPRVARFLFKWKHSAF